MKQLTLFRILTFVLVPIAALFGLMDLLFLVSAIANPALLLMVFVLGSFVVYTFASLKFLTKGIDPNQPCNASLRDWIKVNAYVSLFMGGLFFLNATSILLMSDATLAQIIQQFRESQVNVPALLTPAFFHTLLKAMAWFMLLISMLLLTHILLNFRALKNYAHLFDRAGAE